ncbi:BnaCnng40320D [Brassica napus]|uniref:BnaCnng40320D protein n=1 Tax=Brassica napus TaxID=3708 RepID=A0A078JDE6_BRANA|nr:BnaCnng40320D [Brassica napus]
MEGIDDSVADKVTKALDATIDSKVEARVRAYESDLRNQIAKLEAQINDSKNNADVNIAPDVATYKAYEDEEDGACSNDLKKINSQDGLPVDCVVKKEKKNKKTMDSTQNLTTEVVIKTEKKVGIPLRRVKQEKAFEIPQLNDESISSKDLENHLQWEKSVNCRAVLEALASNLKEPTRRRKPQLTKTQVWPFVRNSTVKRIISGEKVSKEPYDPLAKVEAEKLHKVLDFINSDLEAKEPGVGDESAGFFLKLLIPRDDWPTKDYGWLNDSFVHPTLRLEPRPDDRTTARGVVEEKPCWLKRNLALGQMFELLKKSKPQQDVYFPFKTVFEKEQLIFNKKQFAYNGFDFVQKQRNRQNMCDDENKAVKPTSNAHSTRCFKCHRIGHYANKCQKQKPLVTLENENLETKPEKEDPLPIQIPDQTQDLRTNLFEEEGNDVPRFVDQSIGANQHGDQDALNNLTETTESQPVFPDQLDILRPTVEPDLAWVVKKPKMDMHSPSADHPDSPASVLIFTPCIHLPTHYIRY